MMDAVKIDQQNQLKAMADLQLIIRKEIAEHVKNALRSVVSTIQARTGSISREDCTWTVITRDDLEDWSGQIGSGSFGVVFKARWDTTLVAVKQSHEGLIGKQAFEAVRDEVEKWSKMKIHPNVVPMLRACIHTDKPFLVMPYYQHDNLADYLCIHTDVSVKQRVKWMYDLAAGLHFIHEHGIIHGDLKGDNVLVDHQYNALITDFGLSQIKRAGSSSTQQSVAKKMTEAVRWIAPERYNRKFRLDRSYDVFAYGMTCYQILTGLVPFHEENQRDFIKDWIRDGEVPDRTDDRPVPESVWLLFEACIKKEPAERPKLSEVKKELENSLYYGHMEGELLTVAPQRSTEPQASLEERFKEQKLDSRYGSTAEGLPALDLPPEVRGGLNNSLLDAAKSGLLEECKNLLGIHAQANAQANAQDNDGNTPLHLASGNRQEDICELLIDSEADVNCKDSYGESPIHRASWGGHVSVCRLLLKNGAVVDCQNLFDCTPLHLAAQRGHFEVCKLLIDNGANAKSITKKDSLCLILPDLDIQISINISEAVVSKSFSVLCQVAKHVLIFHLLRYKLDI